jgi:hypothetical protein
MGRTAFLLFALTASAAPAWGQGSIPRPIYPGDTKALTPVPSPLNTGNGKETPTEIYLTDGGHGGLSDWITYRNRCGGSRCESGGWQPAIQSEFYLRVGPSFPFGGDLFGDILSPGWMIQGGAKALFYNAPHSRAWFVDFSIANIYNHANDRAPLNPVVIGGQIATVREYNRTFVGLGGGREWYLLGTGLDDGPTWRVGLDMGGRYGSGCADFTDVKHKSDVIGGVYAGAQSDVEWPMRCAPCVLILGLRGEWAYTWSDVLEMQSDVQDINVLVHIGVRY